MAMNSKLPPLLLRADADVGQGTGHVMRCLALAEAWQARGGRAHLAAASVAPPLRQRVERSGAIVSTLAQPYSESQDLAAMRSLFDRLGREGGMLPWIVVDGYHFSTAYQSAIRRWGGRLLVVDDDVNLASYDADILLNHGVQAPQLEYSNTGDAWLLLGTRYALLRSEFESWRNFQRCVPLVAKNLLITLGGADSANVTVKVLDALSLLEDCALHVQILAGPLNPHLEEIRRRSATLNCQLHTGITDPAPTMAWADIAIATASTTAWELAFMQTPALLLVVAQNQDCVAKSIAEFGTAQSLGWADKLSRSDIAQTLRRLIGDPERRQAMARRGRVLVDGHGPARVLAAMEERQRFNRQSEYTIRLAAAGDELLLWQWSNDPQTRRNSFSRGAISWDSHQTWCAKKFGASDCRLWIMQLGRLPVAQIRYDRVEGARGALAEISFSVAPGCRGMGLGTRLLQATAEMAASELGVTSIEGVTLPGNEASRRAFLKAGFTATDGDRIVEGRPCNYFRRDFQTGSWSDCHVSVH